MLHIAFIFFGIVTCESIIRFLSLARFPFSYRLAYACFVLTKPVLIELDSIKQRMFRGGFKSLDEMIAHYVKVSGSPRSEILSAMFPSTGFMQRYRRGTYYSGIHGVVGLRPTPYMGWQSIPNQSLATISTDDKGFRRTGCYDSEPSDAVFNVAVVGGSVAFGLGALSDENSVPGILQKEINRRLQSDGRQLKCRVYNFGCLGYTSFQEFLCVYRSPIKFDAVLSLTGFNDVDQYLQSGTPEFPSLMNAFLKSETKSGWFVRSIRYLLISRSLLVSWLFNYLVNLRALIRESSRSVKVTHTTHANANPSDSLYSMR